MTEISTAEQVIDAAEAAFNAHDEDAFVAVHAPDVMLYGPDSPEPQTGHDAVRRVFRGFVGAFPDLRLEPQRVFGHEGWWCHAVTMTGTHTGPLVGPGGKTIPPTNLPVRIEFCGVIKVEDGQITEIHRYSDRLALLAQLGLAP